MKQIYRLCLCILVVLGVASGVTSAQEEWMPDPNLRRAVREKLNLPQNTPLTVLHLERLHDLVILESDIASLRGLEHAVNLHFLHLSNSKIADLTPLAELFSLETLKLYGNNISDVSPLANLTNLEELNLSSNRISDLHPLASLQDLATLSVADNPIYDFSPLIGLENLQSIEIMWDVIIDVDLLQKLTVEVEIPDPNLMQMIRKELSIPNGIPLTQLQMQRLTGLNVPENQVSNLRGLEQAKNLMHLSCQGNSISDLSPLSNLTQLKGLYLGGNQISDITPLVGLIHLEFLHLWRNQIVDISPLAGLINLKDLLLEGNQIKDFTPLLGLTKLENLNVDDNFGDVSPVLELDIASFKVCDVHRSPILSRIENREYPSVFAAWANVINLSTLTESERLARHDLYFCCPMFGLGFVDTKEGIKLVGDLGKAIQQRRELQTQNPNMVLLAAVRYFSGVGSDAYPEDWPHWLRDKRGNRVIDPGWDEGLLDFTQAETQEWVISQAAAVAKCGLFDGIFLDHWNEWPRLRSYRSLEEEHAARDTILRRIRAAVPEDFLIMVNSNHEQIPRWAPYVNGLFMETRPGYTDGRVGIYDGYTDTDLIKIQGTLLWAETTLREPRINGLEGFGIRDELPDSPRNQQWMRFFTTMSLTHSDGYVLYAVGLDSLLHEHIWYNEFFPESHNDSSHVHDHDHYWYDFWDTDLGQPIGEKAQLYENREGLFIREFTNGWAVYNRSGASQAIQLPEQTTGVESDLRNTLHILPDLDGEIYLKRTTDRHDVNEDGIVNILDLVAVANGFGKNAPDVNADGVVNVLDLVAVANAFESP